MEPTEPEISPEEPVLPEPEQAQSLGETFEAIGEAISETFDSAVEAVGEVIEAFQTAGLDMTQEERKQAQSVVIPSVIVAQIATLTFRK
jgi:regulator of PEP synthase PpsR (kinase-PPPase family)